MPDVPWFGDSFIGSEVSFTKPDPSTWRLKEKISENADHETEEGARKLEMVSEARAVFICSRVDDPLSQEAVIKIRMQVPNMGTETRSARERAKQAQTIPETGTQNEVMALSILTHAACSSAPTMLNWKQEIQSADMWLLDGYIVYILMNKLPGIRMNSLSILPCQERHELRESFKAAWLDCQACSVVNDDSALRNILWDNKNKKCYIVDFEMWSYAEECEPWQDSLFSLWNLLIPTGCCEYEL